jgi:hypothetical protein
MASYLIAEHKITDPAKFEEYRIKVGPMIAKHGRRYRDDPKRDVCFFHFSYPRRPPAARFLASLFRNTWRLRTMGK